MSTSAHAQTRVMVFNLKLYDELPDSYVIGPPGLRWPPAPSFAKERRPAEIPKIMIEELVYSKDKTLIAFAIMERWVAEQNHFDYNVIREESRVVEIRRADRNSIVQGHSPTEREAS